MTNKAEGTHLVSDEKIIKTSESYADLMITKNDGESYSTHLSGCEYGSKNIRDIYEADRSALLRERDALQAFKDYVHQRLDEAAIATHPPGEHADAGCRVGQRMDLLVGERDEAKRLHMELIYAVARKFDGESRHETALRYIEEAEKRSEEGSSVSTLTPDQK